MKIKYSPESISDLNRLVEFIEAKNSYTARRISIDIQEVFDNLKRFPKMGLPASIKLTSGVHDISLAEGFSLL